MIKIQYNQIFKVFLKIKLLEKNKIILNMFKENALSHLLQPDTNKF